MLKQILASAMGVLGIFSLAAQTDSSAPLPKLQVSGFLDAYYRYNANNAQHTNDYTSFTNSHNSFELGMASVRLEHHMKKVGAVIDMGLGKRVQEFSYNDGTNTLAAIKQAYITYQPTEKIKLTMGKFATHLGYELVDATANRNYSMSYAFSYGPFFHTGVKVETSLGKNVTAMLGVANPTDFSSTSSPVKVAIAQLGFSLWEERIKTYLNYQGGTGLSQADLVATASLSKNWLLGFNSTVQSAVRNNTKDHFSSQVVYLQYTAAKNWSLNWRSEFFDDRDQDPLLSAAQKIDAHTLSGNIVFHHLTLIPEIRLDHSKGQLFSKSDGNWASETLSFLFAAVYRF